MKRHHVGHDGVQEVLFMTFSIKERAHLIPSAPLVFLQSQCLGEELDGRRHRVHLRVEQQGRGAVRVLDDQMLEEVQRIED